MADEDEEFEGPSLDESLAELQRQQEEHAAELARRKRETLTHIARQAAQKQVARMAKKTAVRAGAAAASAAWSAFVAALPWILTVLGILAAIIFIILLVIVSITAICYSEGLTGSLAQLGSTALAKVNIIPVDVCEAVSGFKGAVNFIDQTNFSR